YRRQRQMGLRDRRIGTVRPWLGPLAMKYTLIMPSATPTREDPFIYSCEYLTFSVCWAKKHRKIWSWHEKQN
ncbi:hypothetical protein AAAA50_22550, partial [Escherichia coli]